MPRTASHPFGIAGSVLLVSVLLVAGCAGHDASSPRTVAETKAAFAHHGITLVADPGGDGPGVRVLRDLEYRFSVAVYSTVGGARRRERLNSTGGFVGLGGSARARNVFATWAPTTDVNMRPALAKLFSALADLR